MCLQRRAGPPLLGLLLPLVLLGSAWLAGEGAHAGAARGRGRTHSRLLDGDDALGSPGELAWQAWLLMDGSSSAAGAGAEAGGARRITPKSVFIAPAFAPQQLPPCADGHKRDAAGRCVQVVHINRDAQLSFLLQRLNALHARPAPGRIGLPPPFALPALPARVHDAGPFKVPLRVPLPTSTTTAASTTASAEQAPTTTTTEDAPAPSSSTGAAAPAATTTDELPSVSVVMADMAKRSSGEQADGPQAGRPLITVWTVENNTLRKSQDVDGGGASLAVELPTTEAAPAPVPAEEEKQEAAAGAGNDDVGEAASQVHAPLAQVPADALPMLVISPGTDTPAPPTTPMPDASAPAPSNGTAQGEGSGDPSEAAADDDDDDKAEVPLEGGDAAGAEANPPPKQSESDNNNDDDDGEAGSADVMEHIEVVPISEHSRHNLPIMGEDHDQDGSFSQSGVASGIAGMFRPIPLEVIGSSPSRDEAPPQSHRVRFPSETSERDEPQTVHFFKGNYIKFPTEHAYRYKHRPVTEEFPDVKQTFWWIPSGWRIEQQRHPQPSPQDFWPRMSLSEDPSLFSQYNPSYHSPLPYQQRQAQYDSQWSSMRKQMTS